MTIEQFNQIPDGEVFKIVIQKSTAFSSRSEQGELVPEETMFVCKKGHADDWAIYGIPLVYIGPVPYYTMVQKVKTEGDKLTMEQYIKEVCDCDEEVYSRYRY